MQNRVKTMFALLFLPIVSEYYFLLLIILRCIVAFILWVMSNLIWLNLMGYGSPPGIYAAVSLLQSKWDERGKSVQPTQSNNHKSKTEKKEKKNWSYQILTFLGTPIILVIEIYQIFGDFWYSNVLVTPLAPSQYF